MVLTVDKKINEIWDVVVIGGGPAGLMAAGQAAVNGCSVLLLEKNQTLGKKLLLTGGGRCNLTNNQPDVRLMLANYKESRKFLFSSFRQFGVSETMDFFLNLGVGLKEEAGGRVFPISDRAQTVLMVMTGYLESLGVKIVTGAGVSDLKKDTAGFFIIKLANKTELKASSVVLATGGVTYPETGSNGEGLKWLKKLGHKIIEPQPSLAPIITKEKWPAEISGATLPEAGLTVWQDGRKKLNSRGSLLFTHFGISGPMVLNLSREIGILLKNGEVTIYLDTRPDLELADLKNELLSLLIENSNRKIGHTMRKIILSSLVKPVLDLSGIDGETSNHSVRKEIRKKLVQTIKALPLSVIGLRNPDKAIYAVGGVKLEEMNMKTMESRLVPGLYIVGDLLNIDRPSGGFSLQLCWTTGYVAGKNLKSEVKSQKAKVMLK